MAGVRRPRAFISYRHTEYEVDGDADARNRQHRAWVDGLVRDLDASGVDAIYDGHIREIFRPLTAQDPFHVPFLAEVSIIGCLICHTFVPIITPSYVGRLGYAGYQPQAGAPQSFVLEEWQLGRYYCNAGVMHYLPIIRAGEPERMAALPLGVGPENTFDMRDPADYLPQIRFIRDRIYAQWDGAPALITLDLADWIGLYIDWCRRNDPRCGDSRIDTWQADLLRPRWFLEHVLDRSRSVG